MLREPIISINPGWTSVLIPVPHPEGVNTNRTPFTFIQEPYIEHIEWMESESGRSRWHPCAHYSLRTQMNRVPHTFCAILSDEWWDWSPDVPTFGLSNSTFGSNLSIPNEGLIKLEFSQNGQRFLPLPPNWEALRSASLKKMLPGIRPQLSIVNSLYELKDIPSVGRTLRGLNALGDRLRSFGVNNLRGRASLALILRSLFSNMSDVTLQMKFNVLPLLSDIEQTLSGIQKFRDEVKYLLSHTGIVQKTHYRMSLMNSYPNSDETVEYWPTTIGNDFPFDGSATVRRLVTTDRAMFNASLEYSYEIPGLDAERALLAGLLDKLGVNFNAGIIWRAVPWTFVVDWVLGVSQYLDRFQISNIKPVTAIHRYCSSFSVNRTTQLFKRLGIGGHIDTGSILASSHSEKAYLRSIEIPDWRQALSVSGINSNEFILTGALAGSRLKR